MKKFILFILLLLILIVSEYYFLTEIFSQKRPLILVSSLLLTLACIFGLFRFSRRSFISS